MKGQFSRYGVNALKKFSGLYNQQGRMITDSDLNEAHNIQIKRTVTLGDDSIKSGVPAVGGMVEFETITDTDTHITTHNPALKEGDVYVDGIRGCFMVDPDAPQPPLNTLAYFYNNQGDFPSPPTLGQNKFLYVDLWERPIFWFEDSDLVDPGWHGADTAFRTHTMVQVKTVLSKAKLFEGRFPQKGSAVLASFLIPGTEEDDPCDPCAKELDITVRTGNKLVRLEVLDVKGPANHPTEVLLAWSDENAAQAYPTGKPYPEGFDKTNAVYEFFSEVTETHLGVFEDPDDRKRSQVVKGLSGPTPKRDDLPGNIDFPFVRRWNGSVWVKFTYGAGSKVTSFIFADASHPNALSKTAETIKLEFGNIRLSLRLHVGGNPKDFVAGDYWLTLVRENAKGNKRVEEITKEPMGITHHYLPLFEIDGQPKPMKLDDEGYRQLSFPPLTDLPADHVSYVDNCDDHFGFLEGPVANVQEALDRMCRLEARHIGFEEQCDDENNTFLGVENVEAALLALCRREAEHINFADDCDNDIFNGASNVQTALTALCDLSARNVKFDQQCEENTTFEGVDNVEEALLALCRREAEHVNFNNTCEDTFGEATTVQQALDALCKPDCCDEHNRYLHDWGAVCGLKVYCDEAEPGGVIVEPGAMVDKTGRLSFLKDFEKFQVFLQTDEIAKKGGKTKTKAATGVKKKTQLLSKGTQKIAVKPEELSKVKAILGETKGVPEKGENVPEKKDDDDKLQDFPASLVLAIRYDANNKTHIFRRLTKDKANNLLDKTFEEKRLECELKFKNIFTLGDYPDEDSSAHEEFPRIKDAVLSILRTALEDCNPIDTFVSEELIPALDTFFWTVRDRLERLAPKVVMGLQPDFPDWQGSLIETNVKIYQAFVSLINATYEAVQECTCAAFILECPGDAGDNLVPLCEISLDRKTRTISKISNISCRKFCLTWRSIRHWKGQSLNKQQALVARHFCEKEDCSERTGLVFMTGTTPSTKTGIDGLGICIPAYNSGTLSPEENIPSWGKEKEFKLKNLKGLLAKDAAEIAQMSGLKINGIVETEGLSVAEKKAAIEGNVTTEDFFGRAGSAYPGDEIILFTNDDEVTCAVLVNFGEGASPTDPGTSQPGTVFTPSVLAGASAVYEKLVKDSDAIKVVLETAKKDLVATQDQIKKALAEFKNNQSISFVANEPEEAKALIAAGAGTVGEMAALTPTKKKAIAKKAGVSAVKMDQFVLRAKEIVKP